MRKLILSSILFMAIVIPGCMKPGPTIIPQPELHAQYQYTENWSAQLGCYYTVTGSAYNSGNVTANRAMLYLLLVDSNTGRIRNSKTVLLGYIKKGDSKTFETTIEGDCGHNYRIDASFGG